MRWMNLEPVIQSEVRKRKINIVYQCMYMESRKMVPMNLFAGQQWRNRHKKQTYGHGEEGEDEMYGESNTETYMTTCKIEPMGICCVGQEIQIEAL